MSVSGFFVCLFFNNKGVFLRMYSLYNLSWTRVSKERFTLGFARLLEILPPRATLFF